MEIEKIWSITIDDLNTIVNLWYFPSIKSHLATYGDGIVVSASVSLQDTELQDDTADTEIRGDFPEPCVNLSKVGSRPWEGRASHVASEAESQHPQQKQKSSLFSFSNDGNKTQIWGFSPLF